MIGACPIASGCTPASAKNVDALAHIDRASDAVLNVSCRSGRFRRQHWTHAPTPIESVAGAGPKSSAVEIRNVSSIEMFAETDAKRRRKQPRTSARPPSASHASGSGDRSAVTSE